MTEPVTHHLDALTLDALELGALARPVEAAARAHLDACARCSADREAAAALRAHFLHAVLPRTTPMPRRQRWWVIAAPVLALAAVMVVWLAWPAARVAVDPGPVIGIKGDPSWQIYANRDGVTFAVHDGTQLAPGDRVRFVVIPEGARYLIIGSVDASGAVTVYYPYGGERSAPVAGARVELPGSIVLDDTLGPERVFAVLSDVPIEATAFQAELRAVGSDAARIRAAHQLALPARAEMSLVFDKVAR